MCEQRAHFRCAFFSHPAAPAAGRRCRSHTAACPRRPGPRRVPISWINSRRSAHLNQIQLGGTTLTTYDANGNWTSRVDGSIVTRLAYDAEKRLIWASVTGQPEHTYAYDDQGRRLRKIVGGTTTEFFYDGQDVLAEYTTWAHPDARTTHGAGTDMPLLRTTLTGTTLATQYFHHDGVGSIIAFSNASGGIEATAQHDAWGNVLARTGTMPRYGFTGQEPDETGLIYYRARYYDQG